MNTSRTTALQLGRFWLLARTHWRSSLRHYLIWLIVVTVIALLALSLHLSQVIDGRQIGFTTTAQYGWYFTGLLLLGPVFAAQHFGPMRNKAHAQMVLMQPASLVEKWCLAIFTVVVAFPVAYTLWFSILAFPTSQLSLAWDASVSAAADQRPSLHRPHPVDPQRYALFLPFLPFDKAHIEFFLIYAALTGISTAGSLMFKRSTALRTVLLGFILLLGTMAISLMASTSSSQPGKILFSSFEGSIVLSTMPIVVINIGFWLCVPLLLWLAVLLALQERDLS